MAKRSNLDSQNKEEAYKLHNDYDQLIIVTPKKATPPIKELRLVDWVPSLMKLLEYKM